MQYNRIQRRPRGFTLIELLLVMVILAILAAVVVTKFAGKGKQARVTAAKTDISNMSTALDAFEVDTGSYPTSEQGLQSLVTNPGIQGWHGPYLSKMPIDPWNNPYVYKYPGTQNASSYDLFCTGEGGKDTSGNEINNWSTNSGTQTASNQ